MMRKLIFMPVAAVIVSVFAFSACNKTGSADLKTPIDTMSYSLGVNAGASFKQNLTSIPGGEVNVDLLISGFVAALKGSETVVAPEQAMQIIQEYFTRVQLEEATKAQAEGEKFLADNKSKEGVKTTESGLQYKVIKEGQGKSPKADSEVKVSYRGTTVDGTEFDKNDSITFNAGQVIKGWTEGLQLMKEGAKYEFYIPSTLGYGEQGAGQFIKPNAALIFEVELIEVLGAAK